jgi:hypothetical protein
VILVVQAKIRINTPEPVKTDKTTAQALQRLFFFSLRFEPEKARAKTLMCSNLLLQNMSDPNFR